MRIYPRCFCIVMELYHETADIRNKFPVLSAIIRNFAANRVPFHRYLYFYTGKAVKKVGFDIVFEKEINYNRSIGEARGVFYSKAGKYSCLVISWLRTVKDIYNVKGV